MTIEIDWSKTSLLDARAPAAGWKVTGEQLMKERRLQEALCAFARAATGAGDAKVFLEPLRMLVPKLSPKMEEQATKQILEEEDPEPKAYLNALLSGAEPAQMLWKLSIAADQANHSEAALDLIDAALLIAPENKKWFYNRGLMNMTKGDPEAALRDAAALAPHKQATAEYLKFYTEAIFAPLTFTPGEMKPTCTLDGLPEGPRRELGAIRKMAMTYATRLTLIGRRLQERTGKVAPWQPPDLSAMLPNGPVELEERTLTFTDGDGDEVEVELDETVYFLDADVPSLMRVVRSEWNALCWLCWSCGMKEVGLPSRIDPPKDFGQAAGMAQQRLWRCRDMRVSGGEIAQQCGIPGFTWNGLEIDAMNEEFVLMAEKEYADLQAMFYCLLDPQEQSPWQDNLRGS